MLVKIVDEKHAPIKMWTEGVSVEEKAERQLENIASLPFIFKHVAVMPDVHVGNGATVGSVIATQGAVIPAAVGVDIGCGMRAIQIPIKLSDIAADQDWSHVRAEIEKVVPHGRTNHGGPGDRGAWGTMPEKVQATWDKNLKEGFEKIVRGYPGLKKSNSINHLGTLGTGNHFIEICSGDDGYLWVMLHSGSRGIGNAIGSLFTNLAKSEMDRYFISLPDKELAYLPQDTELFKDYLFAVNWAQEYAQLNRDLMLRQTLEAFYRAINITDKAFAESCVAPLDIECHHNFVAWENHFGHNVLITRKGAVRARADDYAIIPGSMGNKNYIVRGLGERESFTSCSHGAGRAMSRTEARKRFTIEDLNRMTLGVECRKDVDVLDEIPGAYKDIDAVMLAQKDLVETVCVLKQIVCVKG